MRYAVYYVGGPRDGLREWRDDNLHGFDFEEYAPVRPLIGVASGDQVECRIETHRYVKRPAGRDEYGHEAFVAIHEPMLLRG